MGLRLSKDSKDEMNPWALSGRGLTSELVAAMECSQQRKRIERIRDQLRTKIGRGTLPWGLLGSYFLFRKKDISFFVGQISASRSAEPLSEGFGFLSRTRMPFSST